MNILVVHQILPCTDRSGSEVRLMQIVRELQRQNHEVTYLARWGKNQERYAPELERMKIRVYAHDAEHLRYAGEDSPPKWILEQVLQAGKFDVALLTTWFWNGISVPEHYAVKIRRCSPCTRIVVLTDDVHNLRQRSIGAVTKAYSDFELTNDYKQREFEIYSRADLVVTVSEDDRQSLLLTDASLEVENLPMIAEPQGTGLGFEERRNILFVGDFNNEINRDGMRWFLDEVWPFIYENLQGIQLLIAGNGSPPELATRYKGVESVGYVADLEPLFARHRVFVSPIRCGTGVPTKNIAALAHGLPLVTTTTGARALRLSLETDAMIADNPDAFAAAATRVYTNRALWNRLAREGREHIVQRLSTERQAIALRSILDRVTESPLSRLDSHYTWSCLRVEDHCPEVLTYRPAAKRVVFRALAYLRFAKDLLSRNQPAEALEQVRHIFSFFREQTKQCAFYGKMLACAENCYRALGERDLAEQIASERT